MTKIIIEVETNKHGIIRVDQETSEIYRVFVNDEDKHGMCKANDVIRARAHYLYAADGV
jgi:hypothetical protein